MPSFVGTPLQIAFTGEDPIFNPDFFTSNPLALVISFPTVDVGPGRPDIGDITTPRLDNLPRQITIVNNDDTPTMRFQLIWQQSMDAIEKAFAGLTSQVTDLTVLLDQIQAAQALAQAANVKADEVQANQNIAISYTDPISILTADSGGVVSIIAHTRVYGDGSSVSVNGGSVGGFSQGDYVSVYYDDAAHAGGAVLYIGTIDEVAQSGTRHSVGQILIPITGEVPSQGGGVSPPGYSPRRNEQNVF